MKADAASVLADPAAETRLRILLIGDPSSDIVFVQALLATELRRATIDVAASLDDALMRLQESHYDVALNLLSLPGADESAVVHAIRAAHPDTALLVITGRIGDELTLWALAEGRQDHLDGGQRDGPRLATVLLHVVHRHRAEHEERRHLELARGLLDAIDSPTCVVDETGDIVAVNDAWLTFTRASDAAAPDWGIGINLLQGSGVDVGSSGDRASKVYPDRDGLREVLSGQAERHQREYVRQRPHEERWHSARISPVQLAEKRGAVLTHVDVTDMHRAQEALLSQSLHDALTGLPNRLLLTDRLTQALADGRRRDRLVGVAFLDLDNFKRINDSLGHAAGDVLLQQVADRLSGKVRSTDTLSRFSGDEFVVIWRDIVRVDDARVLTERLAQTLAEPFDLGGSPVRVSASIGVIVGRPLESADELLMAADAAMYDAKRGGGGHVRMFSDALRRDAEENVATEIALRGALARSELAVHYQPVMDLHTGKPVAVEALVRWEHPERGLLGPHAFIPLAESNGLIVELGRWVLERACHDAVAFTGVAKGLGVAVNLSTRQLTPAGVVDHVRDALTTSGLEPHRLMLEVTESAFMEDDQAAAVALDALHALGVRIAIDDFGTGYSSLLYLRRYPITALKLDRAFVSGLGVHLNDDAICRNVISLAHAVGATSIAEGVETPEQYAALLSDSCMQGQGFLWSPAVPLDELTQALARAAAVPVPVPAPCYPSLAMADLAPLSQAAAAQLEALRASGASPHTIAAALNQAGMLTPSGSRWTAISVHRHLSVRTLSRVAPIDEAQRSRAARSTPRDRQRALDRVGTCLGRALRADDACLVIASAEHRASLRLRLAGGGLADALDTDVYVERDAVELLETFMRDGLPVPALFEQVMAPLVDEAGRARSLHAYGELVHSLASVGNLPGALQVEALWKNLRKRRGVSLITTPKLIIPVPRRSPDAPLA